MILVPLILGILCYEYRNSSWHFFFALCILALGWVLYSSRRFFFYPRFLLLGVLFVALVGLLGCMRMLQTDVWRNPNYYGHTAENADWKVLMIGEQLKATEKNRKYIAEVLLLRKDSQWLESCGKCYFYALLDSPEIAMGSILLSKASYMTIQNSGNPYCFDYKKYALRQGISGSYFSARDGYHTIAKHHLSWVQKIKQAFVRHGYTSAARYLPEKYRALFVALSLGNKSEMDINQKELFADHGLMHLIALSGMHIGVLWGVLYFLVSRMGRTRKLGEILVLIVLWVYAYSVGFHASIVRAVLLLSIWRLAELLGRQKSSTNSLIFTACMLLLYRPRWLMDVGFQLSFLATLGIILYYPSIRYWMRSKYRSLNAVTGFIALNIAAQLLSFPLILYYFHQFPFHSLVSNSFASICIFGLVPLNLLLLLFSGIEGVAIWIAKGISLLSKLLFSWLNAMDNLDFAMLRNLYLSPSTFLLLCLFIIAVIVLALRPNKIRYVILILALVSLMSNFSYITSLRIRKKEVIIFHLPKKSCIDVKLGSQTHHYYSDDLSSDDLKYNVSPYRNAHFTMESDTINTKLDPVHNTRIDVEHKRLKVLHRLGNSPDTATDVVLLQPSLEASLQEIKSVHPRAEIVIDGSIPWWELDAWIGQSKKDNIPVHFTAQDGAYLVEL